MGRTKKPRNPKVWIIIAAVLVVLGIGLAFGAPYVIEKIRDSQQKTSVVKKSTRAPASVPNAPLAAPKVKGEDLTLTLNPREMRVMSVPSLEQVASKMDAVDRILETVSKSAGSLITVVGALVAFREYKAHKKRKRTPAKD